MTRVVLASASPGRRKVLRQAGIEPVVVVSGVDEDAVIAAQGPDAHPAMSPTRSPAPRPTGGRRHLDSALSADCVVIGCDSMLYLDGALRGKPGIGRRGAAQWESMAAARACCYTGHCVIRLRDGEVIHREVESACTTVISAPVEAMT